jgi:hypothetical protein
MSGGLTMKKIFFVVSFLFLSLLLFGCQTSDDGTVLFSDNFDYAVAIPWDLTSPPVNGWSKPIPVGPASNWNIVGNGNPANALEYNGSGRSQLANTFTGSDYQISVQFKPGTLSTDTHFCLAGRIRGTNACYVVCVSDNAGNIYLDIENYVPDSVTLLASSIVSTSLLDSSTWYTLTMTLQGSTITGDISGGGLIDTTVTFTDTTYPNGGVGIMAWSGTVSTFEVLFDNYQVTSITSE